jgi:integrase
MTIRKTAKGWIADVSVGGQRLTAQRRTKAEAMAAEAQLLERIAHRAAAQEAQEAPAGFTIAEARTLSLQIRWANTSYERVAAIYSKAAVDFFGPTTPLASIDAPEIERWRQALAAGGNQPATINKKVSAVKAMVADAQLHGKIGSAPRLPRQLKESNTRDRVVADWEREAMARWFQANGEPAAADLLVWLLETGCRWGEAEKLRGGDVNLTKPAVSFHDTKNGDARSVPLTRRAVDAISPHLPARPGHRVWPYSYNQFERLFDKAAAGCGINDPALVIHSCRHTCASKLASAGISMFQLMKWGGWRSLGAVQRYAHVNTGALAACVDALEAA